MRACRWPEKSPCFSTVLNSLEFFWLDVSLKASAFVDQKSTNAETKEEAKMICSIEQKQAYKARKELKQFFFVFFEGKSSLEKLWKEAWDDKKKRSCDLKIY